MVLHVAAVNGPCVGYRGAPEETRLSCHGERPTCETRALRGYNGIARVPSPGRDTGLSRHNRNTGESR